jgi:hypothetical protein
MKVDVSLLSNGRFWIWAAFAAAASAFAACFVSLENTVYHWDYATYWQKVVDIVETLGVRPLYPILKLFYSVRMSDYNDLPAWPVLPFGLLFGTGRLSYVLSILNVYALPCAACFAWLALDRRPRSNGLSAAEQAAAALVFFLNPFVWDPVLNGYLDIGGLLLVNIALGLFWSMPLSEKRPLKSLVLMALALAAAVLFRRWYAFWVESFFVVTGGLALFQAAFPRAGRPRWTYLKNWLTLGVLSALIFAGLSWPLPLRFIGTDYADIYSAYASSAGGWNPIGVLAHTAGYFGWFHVGWALAGFCLAAGAGGQARSRALFMLAQTGLTFLLFSRVQDFGPHHYYLLLQAILLFQVHFVLCLRGTLYRVLIFAAALVFFAGVFLPPTAFLADKLTPLAPWIRHAPRTRADMPELRRLVDHLRMLDAGSGGRVYVLASSHLLNSDTLKWAKKSADGRLRVDRSVLRTHSVDKVDGFPESLFKAEFVVVGDPIQYHLRQEDQRVVGVLAESFLKGEGVSAHYLESPESFLLDGGVRARLFRRKEPVPEEEIRRLRAKFRGFYPSWSEDPPPSRVGAGRLKLEKMLGLSKLREQGLLGDSVL